MVSKLKLTGAAQEEGSKSSRRDAKMFPAPNRSGDTETRVRHVCGCELVG